MCRPMRTVICESRAAWLIENSGSLDPVRLAALSEGFIHVQALPEAGPCFPTLETLLLTQNPLMS